MPKPERPVSVRDLAACLNISRTTVSLALRNHPRISEAMRKRVQACAAEAGYQPNAMVNALMTHMRRRRTHTTGEVLAFLTAGESPQTWCRLPTIVDCFDGVRAQAERQGFKLETFWLGKMGEASRQVARILGARGVRASVLALLPDEAEPLDLAWDRHPVVALGYTFGQKPLHQVAHAHFNGMLTCYRELRKLGYKRIGAVLTDHDDHHVNHYWSGGFFAAQNLYGGKKLPLPKLTSYDDKAACVNWFKAHRPDAIIGTHPDPALRMLKSHGVGAADGVGYAALDIERGNIGHVSGIRQNWSSMGAALVDMLVGQLHMNEYGLPTTPKVVLIDGDWVPGKTTREA
ncbi:MAG: LacI family DNA-binding transcriptional regulator [Opitutaceae bacterium]|jgi:LacI family transcriptional regulator